MVAAACAITFLDPYLWLFIPYILLAIVLQHWPALIVILLSACFSKRKYSTAVMAGMLLVPMSILNPFSLEHSLIAFLADSLLIGIVSVIASRAIVRNPSVEDKLAN